MGGGEVLWAPWAGAGEHARLPLILVQQRPRRGFTAQLVAPACAIDRLGTVRHFHPIMRFGATELALAFGLPRRLRRLPVVSAHAVRALRRLLLVARAFRSGLRILGVFRLFRTV
jgi:hypothetical protein